MDPKIPRYIAYFYFGVALLFEIVAVWSIPGGGRLRVPYLVIGIVFFALGLRKFRQSIFGTTDRST